MVRHETMHRPSLQPPEVLQQTERSVCYGTLDLLCVVECTQQGLSCDETAKWTMNSVVADDHLSWEMQQSEICARSFRQTCYQTGFTSHQIF